MVKLGQGLTPYQMQLLAFAIFSTQQDGKTEFRKYEFQDKFGIKNIKLLMQGKILKSYWDYNFQLKI